MEVKQLPGNSWYAYDNNLPSNLKLDEEGFEKIWNLHPNNLGQVKIYGKVMDTPRWHQSYGKDYTFSGMQHESREIKDEFLLNILKTVQVHSGLEYNGILINWYEDGNHYIGPHADDEKELVQGSAIYSFSYGQERDFKITSKKKSPYQIEPITVSLENNSLIVMGGDMQKHYKHSVPKRALSKCANRRINITVRLFK